jgi:uncharacterized membrane protein
MSFFEQFSRWAGERPGQVIGALTGFVFGIMILLFGPVKTILVLILAAIGFILGKFRDEDVSLLDELSRIFKRKKRD